MEKPSTELLPAARRVPLEKASDLEFGAVPTVNTVLTAVPAVEALVWLRQTVWPLVMVEAVVLYTPVQPIE